MKISEYLTERQEKYEPSAKEVTNLRRLEKIDFEGNIHLSDKPSKTKMIIVQPGDLVISGINVAKGAIAVWDGGFPVTVTIHYSSYEFDKKKLNIEYPLFRKMGLCTSSGIVESGCRHVIGARVKQSDMHWTVQGANDIIALRCNKLSGRFDAFMAGRKKTA